MQFSARSISRQYVCSLLLTFLLLGMVLFTIVAPGTIKAQPAGRLVRLFKNNHFLKWSGKDAPNDAMCHTTLKVICYSPQEMQRAYDLNSVLDAGDIGAGQTIVIIDSFGSPTLQQDLHTFDTDYGLPDPPSLRVLTPLGSVPFDPNNNDQVGWAEETSLDVQWAHAIAPGAGIVVLTSPISETQGLQGMPEFLTLEFYALSHHLGNIISQSWGTTENTLFTPQGRQLLDSFNAFYQVAAQMNITVLAAAGDTGAANPDLDGNSYPFPSVGFPASSPWVTTVGGTSLYADVNGNYQNEMVWNKGIGGATGGGVSQYFRTPSYQKSGLSPATQNILHGFRALPDVAYNADPGTSIPVYLGFFPPDKASYYLFGGTSEGTPQWAGLIADADQLAGHSLGFLNDKLYALGHNQNTASTVFHDIIVGNNSQGNIPGYNAAPGWDATTGWGTPLGSELIAALAR